jgi:hypothetical protein
VGDFRKHTTPGYIIINTCLDHEEKGFNKNLLREEFFFCSLKELGPVADVLRVLLRSRMN